MNFVSVFLEMLFKVILFLALVDILFRTICFILVEGIVRKIYVKLFMNMGQWF